ncbi:hypothetical protein [Nostoc sp.]
MGILVAFGALGICSFTKRSPLGNSKLQAMIRIMARRLA